MLTVCPTPIGNLGDITERVLEALRSADVIACEDTRRTRALLSALGIAAPRLVVCDERSEERRAPALAAEAANGRSVVLVSDAGMPGVADPGRELVRLVLEAGAPLTVLPGPGGGRDRARRERPRRRPLRVPGLGAPGDRPAAPLPRVCRERRAPESSCSSRRGARVSTLAALAEIAPDARCALCRELTKLYEEVVRGSAAEVSELVSGRELRGEVAIVISGQALSDTPEDVAVALAAVAELVEAGVGTRQASSLVARLTGQPRRALYDAAVAGKRP